MDLIKEWAKPRTVFALMIYGGFIYGFATDMISPDAMIAAFNIIVGFHFGAKKAPVAASVNGPAAS